MGKLNLILTDLKDIDYEGLKLDQYIFELGEHENIKSLNKTYLLFEDILNGVISLN